ncbi:hypothetical protein Tco_1075445, partial [Tanacetum coccineum]
MSLQSTALNPASTTSCDCLNTSTSVGLNIHSRSARPKTSAISNTSKGQNNRLTATSNTHQPSPTLQVRQPYSDGQAALPSGRTRSGRQVLRAAPAQQSRSGGHPHSTPNAMENSLTLHQPFKYKVSAAIPTKKNTEEIDIPWGRFSTLIHNTSRKCSACNKKVTQESFAPQCRDNGPQPVPNYGLEAHDFVRDCNEVVNGVRDKDPRHLPRSIVFTVPSFQYAHADEKQITDIHFKVCTALRIGIKPFKNDYDVDQFVNFAYQNKWEVKLYVKHHGYDALDIRDQGETIADDEGNESSDAYCSSDDEDLTNYEVVNGYQLWYKRNDWRQVLVYCGRDVQACRCVGYDSIKMGKKQLGDDKEQKQGKNKRLKVNKVTTRSISKTDECTSKSPQTLMKALTSGEGCSESPKWTKAKIASERVKPICGFRLEICLINLSLGQCKRAKQRALFDYEGGLKEHYGRLWEYWQAILDSNLGSTCELDDEETSSGNYYFRRIYVCFKGVKDGWLAGCRKRLVAINRVSRSWEHIVTPSIKRRLEHLNKKQRDWMVIPSGFQELE